MEHSVLLVNLAFALGAALIGAMIAARLRQSVILGYLLAGVVIGPFTPGFVGNTETIQALADVGIILLMFTVGLEFSVGELVRQGKVATIGGVAQMLMVMGAGFGVGMLLGWPPVQSVFFGAVIAISSTVVLSKTLSDKGEMESKHGHIALAWAAVQDLGTIVLVVVLSAVSGGGNMFPNLPIALGKAAVFIALSMLVGRYALPWVFERVAGLHNREVFALVTAAVALGMAYVSSLFGLSVALGAFVAGIVVSESDLSYQILGQIMPLRDIFAALFFVSVGMLVNPLFVVQHLPLVLLTLALIVVLKGAVITLLTVAMKYPVRTALLTGVALAQAAEFSFLLARLGSGLGVVSQQIFNLMLAGAAASIVVAAPLYSLATPLAQKIESFLPESELAKHPELAESAKKRPRRHAVICGYGRVGQVIGAALSRRGFPYVVIDEEPDIIRKLRDQGVPALLGNAASSVLLDRVDLENARVLVVATPDPIATRLIVEYGRRVNPNMEIVVRTHSWAEREFMYRRGIRQTVMGELELALGMTRYTLHRFGVSGTEIDAILHGLRQRAETERPRAVLEISPDVRKQGIVGEEQRESPGGLESIMPPNDL